MAAGKGVPAALETVDQGGQKCSVLLRPHGFHGPAPKVWDVAPRGSADRFDRIDPGRRPWRRAEAA